MKGCSFIFSVLIFSVHGLYSQNFVSEKKQAESFPIAESSHIASIYIDDKDDWLIQKSAFLLQTDIEMVTGKKPVISYNPALLKKNVIIIGTLANSGIIKKLIEAKKITVNTIRSRWEAFKIQTVSNPFKGIEKALVIVGSDKRGAAFGVFELSRKIGVSPWYWWADVPVKKKIDLYIIKGTYEYNSPSVKYRGIFINDEAPAFSGWTREKFGGVNHLVYEKMFELLLRLKANYLWPAMWGNAFNADDSLNPVLADKWGIVMGTTHHEPMLRAQQEWKRFGKGEWNYDSNATVLKSFWRKGIENMGSHESIISIGMRGDGDKPMTEGTAIQLLERIVSDQRKIIEDVTRKPASATPQLWALYKEVQDYYDKGMRVPDDVTLLLCDDNWGNIRKLPKLSDKPRAGGYGIYYHFDYVGGPRNYKWINTNNIARVWEQMHLAYEYGVDKIWIVNVGDLKPMEFPISFFLDYAWNTKKWNEDNLTDYFTQWAKEQFGSTYAKEIGEIIQKYSQFNARRKPELLSPDTYSLTNYNEFQIVVEEYNELVLKAEKINQSLPSEYKDAFFELVLHPVQASAIINELYRAVALNRWHSSQKNIQANKWAEKAKQLYNNDSLLTIKYNRQLAGGKWNHMMDQTHIGYTYWQQPPVNKMPEVKYVSPDSSVDPGTKIDLAEISAKEKVPKDQQGKMFYELEGYVSIEAEHWANTLNSPKIKWKVIPGIGRTSGGISTFPVTVPEQTLNSNGPHVEYDFVTYDSGKAEISAYFSPTLNFHNEDGLKYAVSIDNEIPQIVSINKEDNNVRIWEEWVAKNIIIKTTTHSIAQTGKHVLKYWMISPGIVLQKLVIDFGKQQPSYLGPPETK